MFANLEAAIEELCGTDPAALADTGSIKALHRCLARLEAATTRASASFETAGAWQASGARTAAVWMTVRCGLPSATARRRLRLGRALRHLPVAEEAWVAGDIGEAQVAVLAKARTPVTEEALARDEKMLVAEAKRLRFDSFTQVMDYWTQHADPVGTEDSAENQRDARALHLSKTFAGSWVGNLVLDPINGAIVANQLRRIEDELFDADWAEARARLGEAAGRSVPHPGPTTGRCVGGDGPSFRHR